MSKGRAFRRMLEQKPYLFTPGITTPLHAKIVERAGFDYVYVGGYDVSLTLLGLPDVGLITEPEMVVNAGHIVRSVDLPVIADADTGYGNAINVTRTVRNFEAAGVAGIHIEDQVSPKRCGHVAGKTLVSLEEAVGKLRAALDARKDEDFLIIARTDAIAAQGGGLEEAIRRGKAYAEAGCQMVWCEFPSTDMEIARLFAAGVQEEFPDLPLYFNFSSNLDWRGQRRRFRRHRGARIQSDAHVSCRDAGDNDGNVGLCLRSQDARGCGRNRLSGQAQNPPNGKFSRLRRLRRNQSDGGEVPSCRRAQEI